MMLNPINLWLKKPRWLQQQGLLQRIVWLILIWTASVIALVIVAYLMRLLMKLIGLS